MIRRYECTLHCERYRVKVSVFSSNPEDVPELAKHLAAFHLRRIHKMPTELTNIQLLTCEDRGSVQ